MADSTITGLPAGTALSGAELFPCDQAGLTVHVSAAMLIGLGIVGLTEEGPFVAFTNFTPGVTTTLPLSQPYHLNQNVEVHFDGVYQGPDQYSLSGSNITFNSPIPIGVQKVYITGGVTGAFSNNTFPVGPTSGRPLSPVPGQTYLDITLGQPIWCLSILPTIWINAAGVSV